jgi:hypothetical protein
MAKDTLAATHTWSSEDIIYFMYTRFPKVLARYKACPDNPDIVALFILYSLGGVFVREAFCTAPDVFPGKVTVHPAFVASPARHPAILQALTTAIVEDRNPIEVLSIADTVVVLEK